MGFFIRFYGYRSRLNRRGAALPFSYVIFGNVWGDAVSPRSLYGRGPKGWKKAWFMMPQSGRIGDSILRCPKNRCFFEAPTRSLSFMLQKRRRGPDMLALIGMSRPYVVSRPQSHLLVQMKFVLRSCGVEILWLHLSCLS